MKLKLEALLVYGARILKTYCTPTYPTTKIFKIIFILLEMTCETQPYHRLQHKNLASELQANSYI